MKLFTRTAAVLFLLLASACCLVAQDEEPQTIKVRRESNLVKAVFDNTELQLVVIDRFGNPRENKIVSYKLWIKGKSNVQSLEGYSNKLNPDMIAALNKQKKAVKIFFTELRVQEDDGHYTKLPDVIDTWFPDCENCGKEKTNRKTW
jgi:hypothetical protein